MLSIFVGIICAWLAVSMPVCQADGSKPPPNGDLYYFEGTLDLSGLKTEGGATVGITELNGARMIKVDFPMIEGYPGVSFPVPGNGWDLSGFTGTQIQVNNPGPDPITVAMRVDNAGDAQAKPWSAELVNLNPGETQTLKVVFGQAFKQPGFKLDPAHVVAIKVYVQGLKQPASILLGGPTVFTAGAAVTAKAPPPYHPYITTTTSPTNHAQPYGQDWELVKDWTFGNKRADATIHNKTELDKDFYYRYIYGKGTLDSFSTSWNYHRDYPEGDPRSLHVFGDDTLTLKARIPAGGGWHQHGIESGLIRGKIPIVPGMRVEMRCKITKGIGTWPNFWLCSGVQYDDGTFSPQPKVLPEIDIFEFWGYKNRPMAKTFSSNTQVFGHPETHGNPYDIFTVFRNSDYTPGMDFSEGFHVFDLDWQENRPMWLVDGHPIKQTYYEWTGPPAELIVANTLGISWAKDDMKYMKPEESNWDFVIDYIRVFKHPGVVVPSQAAPDAPAPTTPQPPK